MAIVYNDRLVETIGSAVMIRTADDRIFHLVRVGDGQMLQRIGSLDAARVRARALAYPAGDEPEEAA